MASSDAGAKKDVEDRLQPQQPPGPLVALVIGAVEGDAKRLDAARGKIDRQHGADGQQPAARLGQHIVNFRGDGLGDVGRPGLEDQRRRRVGLFLEAEKAGEGGEEDQERKQRGEDGERDMARDRPAVVAVEFEIGVEKEFGSATSSAP